MTEAQLTTKIVKWLNAQEECVAWKIHGGPHQRVGIPDIVGCKEGWFFGLEVKRPGLESTLTKIQEATLDKILAAGGEAVVVSSVEGAEEVIANLIST